VELFERPRLSVTTTLMSETGNAPKPVGVHFRDGVLDEEHPGGSP